MPRECRNMRDLGNGFEGPEALELTENDPVDRGSVSKWAFLDKVPKGDELGLDSVRLGRPGLLGIWYESGNRSSVHQKPLTSD